MTKAVKVQQYMKCKVSASGTVQLSNNDPSADISILSLLSAWMCMLRFSSIYFYSSVSGLAAQSHDKKALFGGKKLRSGELVDSHKQKLFTLSQQAHESIQQQAAKRAAEERSRSTRVQQGREKKRSLLGRGV